MNGIEKITARIEDDGQREIDALLEKGRAEAAEIAARYQARAEAEAAEIIARGEKAAAERESRLASVDQLECRKAVLAAKQEVIELAFRRAKEKLLALPQDQYVALLADLAVKASSTGREKLIFSQTDRARVGKAVVMAANARLAEAAAPDLSAVPGEVRGTPAGSLLTKVVTGASAVLQGTAMLTLAEETRPMDGGFILSGGAVEVNCTFDTLIRLQRGALAGQVAKVLFD